MISKKAWTEAIEEDTPAGPQQGEGAFEFIHEESGSDVEVPGDIQISSAVQQAVKRLHENTGAQKQKEVGKGTCNQWCHPRKQLLQRRG